MKNTPLASRKKRGKVWGSTASANVQTAGSCSAGKGVVDFNHHELKLIFTAIRRYQTSQIEEPNGFGLYVELQSILDRLQPSAYSETYLEAADGQKDA